MPPRLLPCLALLLLIAPQAQAREIWAPLQRTFYTPYIKSKIQIREGLVYATYGGNLVRSKDGVHWDMLPDSPGIFSILGLGYLNHTLITAGNPSFPPGPSSLTTSISADDGKSWSPLVHNYNLPLDLFSSTNSPMLVFRQQLFVALSTNQIIRSDNGLHWSKAFTLADPAGMAASRNVIVAAGYDGTILHSNDGVFWQSTRLPRTVLSIAYGDGLFIAVTGTPWHVRFRYPTQHPRTLYASTDGRIWREVLQDATSGLSSISYTGGRWVAVGYAGVRTSFNGRTWTKTPLASVPSGLPFSTSNAMTILGRTLIYGTSAFGSGEIVFRKINDIQAPHIFPPFQELIRPGVFFIDGSVRDNSAVQTVQVRTRRNGSSSWSRWAKAKVSSTPWIGTSSWGTTISLPRPGPHLVQIKATDAVGNISIRSMKVRP
jgi:hypothetical protein